MSPTAQVRTTAGWVPFGPEEAPPRVSVTRELSFRGLPPGARVAFGPVVTFADEGGACVVPLEDEGVRDHYGLAALLVDGRPAGELDLVPGKLGAERFRILRDDLQRVWPSLVFRAGAPTSVQVGESSAVALWRALGPVVRQIRDAPHTRLGVREGVGRFDQVRRPSGLRPAALRSSLIGGSTTIERIVAVTEGPENALVAETLRRLAAVASQEGGAEHVREACSRWLREPPFASQGGPVRAVTHAMRRDSRYRRVLEIYRALDRPAAAKVEGPGELRAGIEGLARLYEYWVFLQVLQQVEAAVGPPLDPGYAQLGRWYGDRRLWLDLPKGTTVRFPGEIAVAFEPIIDTAGSGWEGLALVPHPDPTYEARLATPDVVVLGRLPTPWAVVVDAKFVGRHWVEAAAASAHARYARLRLGRRGVVRTVLAAHPHPGLSADWAGYGYRPYVPGEPLPELPCPWPELGDPDGL